MFSWFCVRDAWKQLGDMNQETAMAAYVEEMKKVAQKVERRDLSKSSPNQFPSQLIVFLFYNVLMIYYR